MSEHQEADIVIVGAGLAGILFAARFRINHPNARIFLLEQESETGGKLACPSSQASSSVYGAFKPSGLSMISPALFDFMIHSLPASPEESGHNPEDWKTLESASVLSAGQFSQFVWDQWLRTESLKIFGAGAAVREWPDLEKLLEEAPEAKDQNFSRIWKAGKKSAAVYALKSFMPFCGIADPLQASPLAMKEKLSLLQTGYYPGPWNLLSKNQIEMLLPELSLKTRCRVFQAKKSDFGWKLETEEGDIETRKLVVAHHPSLALNWLDQNDLPSPVLQIGLKTKPASVVVLTLSGEQLTIPHQLTFIPAEECYCIPVGSSIAVHTVIDYEQSLDAPSVVKAIRRLRRARKKLEKSIPELNILSEHLALVPTAWSYSGSPGEKKMMNKLVQEKIQTRELMFCGDAYGSSWNPDENLIHSVTAASNIASTGHLTASQEVP